MLLRLFWVHNSTKLLGGAQSVIPPRSLLNNKALFFFEKLSDLENPNESKYVSFIQIYDCEIDKFLRWVYSETIRHLMKETSKYETQ